MDDFHDKEITCKECGTAFMWTAGEQEFFASKGLINMPSRCPICRKKAEVKHDYSTTYDIDCKKCHKKAKSPFNPPDASNVLCQECFDKAKETPIAVSETAISKTIDASPSA